MREVVESVKVLSMEAKLNVLGEPLAECSVAPMTGFFRDGCCNTGDADAGSSQIPPRRTRMANEYPTRSTSRRTFLQYLATVMTDWIGLRVVKDLRDELKGMVREKGLEAQVRVFQSGCLGGCEQGVMAVKYPASPKTSAIVTQWSFRRPR